MSPGELVDAEPGASGHGGEPKVAAVGDEHGEEMGGVVRAARCGVAGMIERIEEAAPCVDLDEDIDQVDLGQETNGLVPNRFGGRVALLGAERWNYQAVVFDADPFAVTEHIVEKLEVGGELLVESGEPLRTVEADTCRVLHVGAETLPVIVGEQVVDGILVAAAVVDPQVGAT